MAEDVIGGEAWGPVRCTCGAVLAQLVDDTTVTIDGVRLPFRRSTDHLACTPCGLSYPINELRRVHARSVRRARLRRLVLRASR